MLRGLGPCSSKYEKIRQMFLCGFKNFHVHTVYYGRELGSILLCHRMKKYPDLASTRFLTHSVFKNFYSGERIQKVADWYAEFTGYK